jgi:20S proteasome subunit alpha 7
MLVGGSNRRCYNIDNHIGVAITGFNADGRQLVHRAREEAQSYNETYGHKVIPHILANRLGLYVHYFTLHGSLRPFGSMALIAAYDQDIKAPELYMVEPSGVVLRYFGCAAGKGANAAKTEIEKLIIKYGQPGLTCRQAIDELAKMYV